MPREVVFFGLCFLALVLAAEYNSSRRVAPAGPAPVQAVAPEGMPIGAPPALPAANAAEAPPLQTVQTGG